MASEKRGGRRGLELEIGSPHVFCFFFCFLGSVGVLGGRHWDALHSLLASGFMGFCILAFLVLGLFNRFLRSGDEAFVFSSLILSSFRFLFMVACSFMVTCMYLAERNELCRLSFTCII